MGVVVAVSGAGSLSADNSASRGSSVILAAGGCGDVACDGIFGRNRNFRLGVAVGLDVSGAEDEAVTAIGLLQPGQAIVAQRKGEGFFNHTFF